MIKSVKLKLTENCVLKMVDETITPQNVKTFFVEIDAYDQLNK